MSFPTDTRFAPPAQVHCAPNEAGIWFPYHIKDIRSETYNMSRLEKCAYIDLIEMLWERSGVIPADDKWIAAELGIKPREWASMRERVLRQFVVAEGGLSHPRFSAELEKAKANIEQKRKAGIASAEARKVQRAFNGRSTGVPTSGQPRAGGGGGGGPFHEGELGGGGVLHVAGPFSAFGGDE